MGLTILTSSWGQVRRQLGQRPGEWTEELNAKMMARMGAKEGGGVSEAWVYARLSAPSILTRIDVLWEVRTPPCHAQWDHPMAPPLGPPPRRIL